MKVRVLYPLALQDMEKPPEAGDIIEVSDKEAKALLDVGYVEKSDAKPTVVEQATQAPGERRKRGRPRKNP